MLLPVSLSIGFILFFLLLNLLFWHRENLFLIYMEDEWWIYQKIWILLILLRRHETINALIFSFPLTLPPPPSSRGLFISLSRSLFIESLSYNDESSIYCLNPDCKIPRSFVFVYDFFAFFLFFSLNDHHNMMTDWLHDEQEMLDRNCIREENRKLS